MDERKEARTGRVCRALGVVCQALLLGTLLFIAVGALVAIEDGARVFRYQAF